MSEILFITFVAFLLFGTKKIPEVARGLGKGYQEFQKAADQIKEEINKVANDIKEETNKVKDEVNKVSDDIKNNINDDPKNNSSNKVG